MSSPQNSNNVNTFEIVQLLQLIALSIVAKLTSIIEMNSKHKIYKTCNHSDLLSLQKCASERCSAMFDKECWEQAMKSQLENGHFDLEVEFDHKTFCICLEKCWETLRNVEKSRSSIKQVNLSDTFQINKCTNHSCNNVLFTFIICLMIKTCDYSYNVYNISAAETHESISYLRWTIFTYLSRFIRDWCNNTIIMYDH